MAEPLPNWDTHDVEDLRRFARICLIVADLDGTLVPSPLHQKLQSLIRSLRHYRYQVNLTLATGRTLAGVLPLLKTLPLMKDIPLILYNGSVVVRNGSFSVIERRTISLDSLREVLEISSHHCVRTLAYFYDDPWFEAQNTHEHEYVIGWTANCEPSAEFNNMPVQWLSTCNVNSEIEPSAILIDTSSDSTAAPIIELELAKVPNISATRSSTRYIEVRPKGSNKGVALKYIASAYNLLRDEILALGDNDNDSEMLAWAGIGVSISEASSSALMNSDYVCRHGIFDGAVELMHLVKHARHYFFQPRKRQDVIKDGPHRTMV
jgi:Cof subfamily protein (haloacid dehalogenase superfamily)